MHDLNEEASVVRFIIITTTALIALCSIASAAQNVTSSSGGTGWKNACAQGYKYKCSGKPRVCRCIPDD